MNKKEWEYQLLDKMLEETGEPLCNILLYAAAYLERSSANSIEGYRAAHDKEEAQIINKYSSKMAERLTESRD